MEYVKVLFPSSRAVFIDGSSSGESGELIRVGPGAHLVSLAEPFDFHPREQMVEVMESSASEPVIIKFYLS